MSSLYQQARHLSDRWGTIAPGYVRAQLEVLLDDPQAPLSRGERSNLLHSQASLTPLDCAGAPGKAWFPIVFQASSGGPQGTLAWIRLVVGLQGGDWRLDDRAQAVRAWFTESLAPLIGVAVDTVRERLEDLAFVWAPGHEGTPSITLDGHSSDLAMLLALVRHLAPHHAQIGAPWVVSAAIGKQPGIIEPINHADIKHTVLACEAPEAHACIVTEPLQFKVWLETTCGTGILADLQRAFGQSPAALVDQAEAAWRSGNEAEAARRAFQALATVDTPRLRARCHMILGADAVHRGDLAQAAWHFDAMPATDAPDWNRWDTIEQHMLVAAMRIDYLQLEDVRNHLARAADLLAAVPDDLRDMRWSRLFVQMCGTESKALALAGQLDAALARRREALALGPAAERARNLLELGELLMRAGQTDDGAHALDTALDALCDIADAVARHHTDRFIRIARIRWKRAEPLPIALTTAPVLGKWPQPAECMESLLAGHDEALALSWFQLHVMATTPTHPAYAFYLVTSCARAVANGFTNPDWRNMARTLAGPLPARQKALATAFADGGPPTELLRCALY